jgi:hypothetical protein
MEQWLPLWEILLGAVGLIVSLMIHGVGMAFVQRKNRDYQRFAPFRFRRQATFSLLIFFLMCTHLIEVLLWAAALIVIGAIPGIRDAFYYAAVTYTTLGYQETALSHTWRILAPIMAMSGVFAFGWTTSVLFAIVSAQDEAERRSDEV